MASTLGKMSIGCCFQPMKNKHIIEFMLFILSVMWNLRFSHTVCFYFFLHQKILF